jgi:replicative DNA helicase
MSAKTPPSNAEAELTVIGSVLAYGERSLTASAGLRCDEFYIPAHRDAWTSIVAANAKPSGLVDPISVGAEVNAAGTEARFHGGWHEWAMATAVKACLPEQVSHYAAMVRETAATRKLIELCMEVINRAYSGAPFQELLDQSRGGVADLENIGSKSGTIHVSEAITECTNEIEDWQRGIRPEMVTTAIASLDEILGEIEGGELVLVAARPGKGKTSLGLNIVAANSLRAVPCLMFSLEMKARKLARRLLIWATKTAGSKFRGDVPMDVWKKITKAAGEFEQAKLWINASVNGLGQIVSEARSWHARRVRPNKSKRGIIVVDYAQLVRTVRAKGGNREQEVAQISGTMKALAMSLDVPIFLLSQLSRESERRGGPPMLMDLRESGSLEQDADRILFPHDEMDPEDRSKWNERRAAKIIVGKNRDGAIGAADVEWVPELMTFLSQTDQQEPGNETQPNWKERGEP